MTILQFAIQKVAHWLRSVKCAIAFTGAGISTERFILGFAARQLEFGQPPSHENKLHISVDEFYKPTIEDTPGP